MRIVQLEGAYGIDNLRIIERDPPKPGHGQVLIKLRAASLNYRDLMSVGFGLDGRLKLPYIPLSDGCGEIVEIGPGVTRMKVGDRVCTTFFEGWDAGPAEAGSYLSARAGGKVPGILQEYLCTAENGVVLAPPHLTDEEAASLPCAGLTAWRGLVVEGGLKPGDIVCTEGTGGVSIFALQFAKAAGARVIITSSSDAKLERAGSLGADDGINYKTEPAWGKKVRTLTGGRGADQVMELGGETTFAQALQATRTGGFLCVIGGLTGGTLALPVFAILGSNARVQGITVGNRAQFEDMNRAIIQNKIKPVVDKVFALEEIKAAFRAMESQVHFGKIALRVAD